MTIQVKTSTHHVKANDKWLEWWIPDKCPCDYVAAVDLERGKFWLLRPEEFKQKGTRSGEGYRLWWPLPECEYKRAVRKEEQFKDYVMDVAIPKVFGLE